MNQFYLYRRIGRDVRLLELREDGTVGIGRGDCEKTWELVGGQIRLFGDFGLTTKLTQGQGEVWSGFNRVREFMFLELVPYWTGHVGGSTHRGVHVRDNTDKGIVDEIEGLFGYQFGFRWLPPAPVVIDVGSHIGAFTIYAKRIRPHAKVIAVEPNPDNVHYWYMNCQALRDVHCEPGVVFYDTACKYVFVEHAHMYMLAPEGSDLTCPIWRLEDLAARYGFNDVHFLKLDCEGAEFNILERGRDWIKKHVHMIGGEYHIGAPCGIDTPWAEFVEAYYDDWFHVTVINPREPKLGSFFFVNPNSECARYL